MFKYLYIFVYWFWTRYKTISFEKTPEPYTIYNLASGQRTRHAGYNGQRVATAILFIFVRLGIIPNNPSPYNAIVYMDDFAGCEMGFRATEAFDALGQLLQELGVQESVDKASKPSTKMKFLGGEFNTISMCMRIDERKLQEFTML